MAVVYHVVIASPVKFEESAYDGVVIVVIVVSNTQIKCCEH
jgi:hypothetical protein